MKLKTSSRTYQERMHICKVCPFYKPKTKSCGTLIVGHTVTINDKKYKLCGCLMEVKSKIAFTRCPLGKWERENDLTTDQLSILKRLLKQIGSDKISREGNVGITNLYNEIFGMNKKVSSCGTCVAQTIKELKEVLSSYEDRK